uniref:Uncharacterized protein n=1 Tax=Anopheles atroparvus TaxID=41427 RepID=A0A182IW05_ANOAO
MSFFSSLQQYVTSGVAGLGLNPRRFSLSRQESAEGSSGPSGGHSSSSSSVTSPYSMGGSGGGAGGMSSMGHSPGLSPGGPGSSGQGMGGHGTANASMGSGGGGGAGQGAGGAGGASTGAGGSLGYGKGATPSTLAAPGTPPIRRQSSGRGLDALIPPPRQGSFRGRSSPINPNPPDKPSFSVWKRRPSWPEVEIKSSSGVQENDGSYFESFTALSWKNENRRMSAVRAVETRAEILPENDTDRLLEDDIERSEQKEHLYLDVLYAIANTVGAPAPGGQVRLESVF